MVCPAQLGASRGVLHNGVNLQPKRIPKEHMDFLMATFIPIVLCSIMIEILK